MADTDTGTTLSAHISCTQHERKHTYPFDSQSRVPNQQWRIQSQVGAIEVGVEMRSPARLRWAGKGGEDGRLEMGRSESGKRATFLTNSP